MMENNTDTVKRCGDNIKSTLIEFITDLKENIFEQRDQGDILLVEFFFKRLSSESLASYIVQHILPYKQQILQKKKDFFIEKKDQIFKGLPKTKIDYYCNIITGDNKDRKISPENARIIWDYFTVLVNLAEQYNNTKVQ
jgi:hypothetical protein